MDGFVFVFSIIYLLLLISPVLVRFYRKGAQKIGNIRIKMTDLVIVAICISIFSFLLFPEGYIRVQISEVLNGLKSSPFNFTDPTVDAVVFVFFFIYIFLIQMMLVMAGLYLYEEIDDGSD